jgi:S-adenosylmethionine decarboxylase
MSGSSSGAFSAAPAAHQGTVDPIYHADVSPLVRGLHGWTVQLRYFDVLFEGPGARAHGGGSAGGGCAGGGCELNRTGRHLLAEYHGCSRSILDDQVRLEALLRRAARTAGAHILVSHFNAFAPCGVSGVILLAESHMSIHTWPEYGYAAVDFYTCGACLSESAHSVVRAGVEASRSEVMIVRRGLEARRSLRIIAHTSTADEPAVERLSPDGAEAGVPMRRDRTSPRRRRRALWSGVR